jgi:hypothetical protein
VRHQRGVEDLGWIWEQHAEDDRRHKAQQQQTQNPARRRSNPPGAPLGDRCHVVESASVGLLTATGDTLGALMASCTPMNVAENINRKVMRRNIHRTVDALGVPNRSASRISCGSAPRLATPGVMTSRNAMRAVLFLRGPRHPKYT